MLTPLALGVLTVNCCGIHGARLLPRWSRGPPPPPRDWNQSRRLVILALSMTLPTFYQSELLVPGSSIGYKTLK